MKKIIFVLTVLATLTVTSCKNHDTVATTGADSTAVVVDSVKVDSVSVTTDTVK